MKSSLYTIYHLFFYIFTCWRSSAILILCSIVFSCVDDQDGILTGPVPAVFTISTGDSETVVPTRASNDTWAKGDQVGIFMVAPGSMITVEELIAGNKMYQTTEAGANVSLEPVGTTNFLYYPTDGSKVNFIAYYPYKIEVRADGWYDLDISNQDDPAAIDLLYHKGTTEYSRYNAAAALTFEHKLSKIIINIVPGEGASDIFPYLYPTINNMPTRVTLPMNTGILTNPYNTATFYTRRVSASYSKVVIEAIIIPHNGSGTGTVFPNRTIYFDQIEYTYHIPNSMNFEEGKVYNYDFTLTHTGLILSNSTISNWTGGTAAVTGDDVLSVAPSSFSLTKEARSNNSLIIRANSPLTSENIKFSSNATSIVSTSDLIQNNFTRIGTDTNPYTYELKFGVTSTSSSRSRYIHITIGTQTCVVPVNQSQLGIMDIAAKQPSSNCYIVPPGGAPIAIPVSRANEFAAGAIGSSTAFTAELVWADLNAGNNTGIGGDGCLAYLETNGTGSSGHIIVHPGTREGNAVVAVKVNDEIKWSWHIWVTTYNPWTSEGIEMSDGGRAMDRPLGTLHTAGDGQIDMNDGRGCLVYQWGRKDPFSLESSNFDGNGFTGGPRIMQYPPNAEQLIKTPGGLAGSAYDRENDRWNEDPTTQPCPAGWELPDYSPRPVAQVVWIAIGPYMTSVPGRVLGDAGYTIDDMGYTPGKLKQEWNDEMNSASGFTTHHYFDGWALLYGTMLQPAHWALPVRCQKK